jgi:hypothetical protein
MFFSFDEDQERRIGVFDWINWLYRMVIFRDKKSIFLLLRLEIPLSPPLKKGGVCAFKNGEFVSDFSFSQPF